MAAEIRTSETTATRFPKKRKLNYRKGSKSNKKSEPYHRTGPKRKNPSMKMKQLYQKRVKQYHSDDDGNDEDEEEKPASAGPNARALHGRADARTGDSSEEEELNDFDAYEEKGGSSEEEGDGIQHGITKFTEGCRAFRVAFMKIMKKSLPNDPLGPVLSAHKKLVAEKLAEEEAEHKVKGETKKEKHLVGEKGHIKPATFLDSKEKYLISVATKGVVKLFNAVNKAQNPQTGLNPSSTKDAKELAKRRKQAFFSELQKSTKQALGNPSPFNSTKVPKSTDVENSDEPGWAPLRDSYMLTNPKLKDWDKMADHAEVVDSDKMHWDSSSYEE